MSCDKWNWTPICDTRPCPGDCDICGYDYTVSEDTVDFKGGEDGKPEVVEL